MGVHDFGSVDEAMAKATRYLEIPLPHAMRLPGQDERHGDGSWLNMKATFERDGTLEIASFTPSRPKTCRLL